MEKVTDDGEMSSPGPAGPHGRPAGQEGAHARSGSAADELSIVALLTIILRQRRLVFGLPALIVFVLVGITFALPREYTASTSFMPQNVASARPPLAGLAAQFGFALPASDAGESPAFYADLLRSREILQSVVDTRYEFTAGDDILSGTLVELYGTKGSTEGRRGAAAVDRLRRKISVRTEDLTGLVKFSVKARWAPLAEQIANRALEVINRFNLESRQSQARAEREFIEQRNVEIEAELREAEKRLETFLQRNREFRNMPELSFEHDRLSRDVAMRQQVLTSLVEAYEQARMDEVRATPVITLVERPVLPVRPDSRRLVLKGLLGVALGLILGLTVAFGREFTMSGNVQGREDYQRFAIVAAEAAEELRRVWRPIGRLFRRQPPRTH